MDEKDLRTHPTSSTMAATPESKPVAIDAITAINDVSATVSSLSAAGQKQLII